MEQDVDSGYRTVCTTCLSSDRNLFQLGGNAELYQIFRLLMCDFATERFGDTLSDVDQFVCWECLALMKRFLRFKRQVHSAQEHIAVLALSRTHETLDHTYMSQSLSALEMTTKMDYDKIYFDYVQDWAEQYIEVTSETDVKNEHYDIVAAVRDNINLDMDDHMLEVPQIVLEHPVTGVMSHVVVGTDALITERRQDSIKPETVTCETQPMQEPQQNQIDIVIVNQTPTAVKKEPVKPGYLTEYMTEADLLQARDTVISLQPTQEPQQNQIDIVIVNQIPTTRCKEGAGEAGYLTEYMTEGDLLQAREEAKQAVQYCSAVYKCELCIIGFFTQSQVETHFLDNHRPKPGTSACKVCYVYIDEADLATHTEGHYRRYTCCTCGRRESSELLMKVHRDSHAASARMGDVAVATSKSRKKKSEKPAPPPKPGDLRKLLSKTTIEGYQCLECDMFFKNSRARKNHVARFHREGLQCDHCKKRFVNRTTLATHLKLHEGPLPREECPICHKMVRCIQIKYHIRRHESKSRYECGECNKVFSHLATYQAHLKYSRAHATEHVLKYPCPMCNKGYATKEQMQDHFNYQHLGKTAHKCPICEKPIASKANVEKHMMRVHGEKKEKPKKHTCLQCGKGFTDKKALNQHLVIHSGERPLVCNICQQTFKQKASLYTHRKRVHKVFPPKREVQFMEAKET